jgi:tagatose-1,6-bisphosphate aldolase non-catalytic subunit AgaZ/GatZ
MDRADRAHLRSRRPPGVRHHPATGGCHGTAEVDAIVEAGFRKQALLDALAVCADDHDPERAHHAADELLLAYLADPEIEAAYRAIERWFA